MFLVAREGWPATGEVSALRYNHLYTGVALHRFDF